MRNCIWCKKPITVYNQDPAIAAFERKRGIHWECFRGDVEELLDKLTLHGGQSGSFPQYKGS